MEPTLDELARVYAQYNDADLIHLATKAPQNLRPEAQAVIRSMLRTRNVDEHVFRGMDLMLHPLDIPKLNEQVALIRSLRCPTCGEASAPLNAVLANRAVSFVVMTTYERTPVIGCSSCLRKRCDKASLISGLFGWWGFPWGPIRTVQALVHNFGQRRKSTSELPSDVLGAFVVENAGRIEAYQNRSDMLRSMITEPL